MRRAFLFLPLVFALGPASAQEAFTVEIIQEVEMPRDKIYDNALLWLSESFRSSKAVIDLKDRDLGTIIGNAADEIKIGWGATLPISYKLRIDVRDNRYRLTFSNVTVHTAFGLRPIEQTNRDVTESGSRERFTSLADSFRAYLTSAAKGSTW